MEGSGFGFRVSGFEFRVLSSGDNSTIQRFNKQPETQNLQLQ